MKPTRAELVAIIIGMTLENPNNLCYANATLYALVWTLLATDQFYVDLWGE